MDINTIVVPQLLGNTVACYGGDGLPLEHYGDVPLWKIEGNPLPVNMKKYPPFVIIEKIPSQLSIFSIPDPLPPSEFEILLNPGGGGGNFITRHCTALRNVD